MVTGLITTGLIVSTISQSKRKVQKKMPHLDKASRRRNKKSFTKLHRDGIRRKGDEIEGGRYSYVVIGGIRWQLFSRFSTKKIAMNNVKRLKSGGRRFMGAVDDRRNLEQTRVSAGIRAVRTNEGWAVVQVSPFKDFQIKHAPTLALEKANAANPIVTAGRPSQRAFDRA